MIHKSTIGYYEIYYKIYNINRAGGRLAEAEGRMLQPAILRCVLYFFRDVTSAPENNPTREFLVSDLREVNRGTCF